VPTLRDGKWAGLRFAGRGLVVASASAGGGIIYFAGYIAELVHSVMIAFRFSPPEMTANAPHGESCSGGSPQTLGTCRFWWKAL
jgi:hypothetical protein